MLVDRWRSRLQFVHNHSRFFRRDRPGAARDSSEPCQHLLVVLQVHGVVGFALRQFLVEVAGPRQIA